MAVEAKKKVPQRKATTQNERRDSKGVENVVAHGTPGRIQVAGDSGICTGRSRYALVLLSHKHGIENLW